MGSCNIPEDIIKEILARLPVKSLLKFSSVCKSWLSEISNPSFALTHILHSPTCTILTKIPIYDDMYEFSSSGDMYKFSSSSDFSALSSVQNASKLEPPPCFDNGSWDFVNSCNGIVCLQGTLKEQIALWNPATKRYKLVPPPSCIGLPGIRLGFYSISNDYKLIRIGLRKITEATPCSVEVYSAHTDSWGAIRLMNFTCGILDYSCCNATLKGVEYFVFMYGGPEVITVDLHTEAFGRIPLPYITEPDNTYHKRLMEFKDSVAIAVFPVRVFEMNGLSIWVLDEDYDGKRTSWTKKYTLETFPLSLWPHLVLKSGALLSSVHWPPPDKPTYHLHDLTTEQEIEKFELPSTRLSLSDVSYVESLVSFKGSEIISRRP